MNNDERETFLSWLHSVSRESGLLADQYERGGQKVMAQKLRIEAISAKIIFNKLLAGGADGAASQ